MAVTTPSNTNNRAEPFRLNEHNLRTFFSGSDDVIIASHMIGDAPAQIVMVYCSGMVNSKEIQETILPAMVDAYEDTRFLRVSDIEKPCASSGRALICRTRLSAPN